MRIGSYTKVLLHDFWRIQETEVMAAANYALLINYIFKIILNENIYFKLY